MKKNSFHKGVIIGLMIYLLIPIVFTFLYAIATKWQNTVLPEGFTLAHFIKLLTDIRFFKALLRTILVAVITIGMSFIIILPVVYLASVHMPRLAKWVSYITLLPFALQGVILAVGLIKAYSSGPIVLSGTVYLLIGGYFVVILPYMYQGIKNSMDSLNVHELIEAAALLGAYEGITFRRIVLPNILKGVTVSVLLSFAILIGEFVLSNMLVGGSFETVQVYMFWSRGVSGHFSSAIVITYFLFVLLFSGTMLFLNRKQRGE